MSRDESNVAPQSQQWINQSEWSDLDNWSHPTLGVYFSKRDSRVWVPKRKPSWGWTLNMGNPVSLGWLVGIIVVPMLIVRSLAGRRGS